MSQEAEAVHAFIAHWPKAEANEMAISQSFVKDLTALLDLPQPANDRLEGYSFNFP